MKITYIIYPLLLTNFLYSTIKQRILESNSQTLILQININARTDADLFPTSLLIGLPSNNLPKTEIIFENKIRTTFKTSDVIEKGFEWINQQKLKNLNVATLKISPVHNSKYYYQKVTIRLDFEKNQSDYIKPNISEIKMLRNRVVNWNVAKSWFRDRNKTTKRYSDTISGRWYQFFTSLDEISSIPYNSLELVIDDIASVEPRSLSIFMSKEMGRARTQELNQPIKENIIEVAIQIEGEEDGSFNLGDEIIFYSRGPSGYDVINGNILWNQNIYFSSNSCWLFVPEDNDIRGKRVNVLDDDSPGVIIDYGIVYKHKETDLINLVASGTEWYGNSIPSGEGTYPLILDLPDPKINADFSVTVRLKGYSKSKASIANHSVSLKFGGIDGPQVGQTLNWSGSGVRFINALANNLDLNNGTNLFYLVNSTDDNNSIPYLDYFDIEYKRMLTFADNYEFFSPIINQNMTLSFSGSKPDGVRLWDITDPSNAQSLNLDNASNINFQPQSNLKSRFILFNENNINIIEDLELNSTFNSNSLRNTNVRSDYVVIGPKEFENEVNDLLLLRNPATYASLDQIYSQFSAGNPDPMAIRSFIQWTQELWISPQPNYVLLLGDSGYDYRNINGNSKIIVPTIQVQSSRTYATDDLLATIYGNIPELAIGRFPARNQTEVSNFVEKVMIMENETEFGPWRQKVTLLADDAARPEPNHGSINTGKSHTINSEQLANTIPKSITIDKIYMIEYPEISEETVYGVSKPEATAALLNSLNSGTAILSYIGHGSPYQLAQEKLLDLDRGDINQMNVGNRLPLWIVGTCSFGHFDDPLTESFAEELIRAPRNASSMIIATSRPITVTGNERFTLEIFESIFRDNSVTDDEVGIILQSIKDGSTEGQYFHLFGDPAMQVPMPKDTLTSLTILPDTLETLEIGSFSGQQSIIQNNGEGYVVLTDAEKEVTRYYEIASETHSITYTLPGATLFRGKFTISGSQVNGEIRVPQDISYTDNLASLLVYIYDGEKELRGSTNSIYLTGGSTSTDTFGPHITFEDSGGRRFESGDHLSINDNLIIRLSDPLGINLTNETGHEIKVENLITLKSDLVTSDFYYDSNSITSGTLTYETGTGPLHILVKAWDNANNPSEKEIELNRNRDENLKLYNVYNYPNPFLEQTQFTFETTGDFDLTIDVFSIGGRRVWNYKRSNMSKGFNTITWDGFDSFGDRIAGGLYIYRLKVINKESKATFLGRIAKVN